jgi:hypothetical protein
MFAGSADVGEDTHRDPVAIYRETVGFRCIMMFRKSIHTESADVYRGIIGKSLHKLRLESQPAVVMGHGRDVNRQTVFPGDDLRTQGMISMFMRDEDGPDFPHGQPKPANPSLRFPAGDAGIDQHGIMFIADIITIAVASGIQGGNIEGHGGCRIYDFRFTMYDFMLDL